MVRNGKATRPLDVLAGELDAAANTIESLSEALAASYKQLQAVEKATAEQGLNWSHPLLKTSPFATGQLADKLQRVLDGRPLK